MALAFAPIGLWGFALLAPIPLAWLIERSVEHPWRAGRWAALGVLPFWFLEQSWVISVSSLGYPPMCLYLAGFTVLLVWAGTRLRRRWPGAAASILLPVAWVGVDFLRGAVLFEGYPWYFVAHPLIDFPRLAWPAAFLGVYAVNFVVVALGGALLDLKSGVRRRSRAGMVALGLGAIVVVAGGAWSGPLPVKKETLLRVGVIQTNVPQDNKIGWSLDQRVEAWDRFERLMDRAAAAMPAPHLLVLPETMFPGWTLDPASLQTERNAGLSWRTANGPQPTTMFADRLLDQQARLGLPIMIGAVGHDGFRLEALPDGGVIPAFEARYNSVVVVDGGEVQSQRYDKLHLTPFGEAMPYISLWPWLQQRVLALGANGMAFDLSRGRGPVALSVRGPDGPVAVATPICFEATMPGVCRSLVFDGSTRRAAAMISLTNDGWFGSWDAGRRQHEQLARWRCLELGTPMVRSANTGISALIDARGQVVREGVDGSANPSRVEGVLVVDVPTPLGVTIYARVGDATGALALLLATGGVAASFWKERRRAGRPA